MLHKLLPDYTWLYYLGKEKTRKSPSRRDKRQQARVQKKARKAAFFSNKKGKVCMIFLSKS